MNPQIILGPLGAKTVTTGVYAAFGQYVSDYTVIFPDLLLVLAPILVFFVVMQRHIVNGLTTGARTPQCSTGPPRRGGALDAGRARGRLIPSRYPSVSKPRRAITSRYQCAESLWVRSSVEGSTCTMPNRWLKPAAHS